METVWFWLLAWMLGTYVVLDGFDFGVGILHLFVARNEAERDQVIRSIGPVWDGNEVWLIAAGGTMFFAFPKLLAVSFSGFYLALMIVLWLLMFRALGIELRHHIHDPLFAQFWDVAFATASVLLTVCLGAALGNLVRGVPLREDGTFFAPLWTDFRVGQQTGILDWYTALVALTAVLALAHHGALWLYARTDEAVAERAVHLAGRVWPLAVALSIVTTIATVVVQPNVRESLAARPWGVVFIGLAVAGMVGAHVLRKRGKAFQAFLASAAYLYGMVALAAIGIYPYVLPGRNPALGLTLHDAAAAGSGLVLAMYWWIPGMVLACAYTVYVYSTMPAKFSVHDAANH
ncbi:MAG: cytochrome d ubiquinol oxidase subunit II [candidate division NC10 bacterium]|nr:cytochrome d ubiquinol oxidase subunit II [candidate division NC10 bacterium]